MSVYHATSPAPKLTLCPQAFSKDITKHCRSLMPSAPEFLVSHTTPSTSSPTCNPHFDKAHGLPTGPRHLTHSPTVKFSLPPQPITDAAQSRSSDLGAMSRYGGALLRCSAVGFPVGDSPKARPQSRTVETLENGFYCGSSRWRRNLAMEKFLRYMSYAPGRALIQQTCSGASK